MTPLRVANWADANAGAVGDLQALTDPGADRALYWNDTAGAVQWTANLPDSVLSSNVPLLNAPNEFTNFQEITSTSPQLYFEETDAGTDAKRWRVQAQGDVWAIDLMTDANAFAERAFSIARSSTNATTLALAADTITANGAEIITTAGDGLSKAGASLAVDSTVVRTTGATFTGDIAMTGTRAIDATTRLNLTGTTVSVGEAAGNLAFFADATGASIQNVAGNPDVTTNGVILTQLLGALESYGLITRS